MKEIFRVGITVRHYRGSVRAGIVLDDEAFTYLVNFN